MLSLCSRSPQGRKHREKQFDKHAKINHDYVMLFYPSFHPNEIQVDGCQYLDHLSNGYI